MQRKEETGAGGGERLLDELIAAVDGLEPAGDVL
jgi:hypothetical protein